MRPLCQLASQDIHYTMIPAETDGTTHPESIEALIRPETKAVIMLHASNVCGTILPIREIGEICRRRHLFFACLLYTSTCACESVNAVHIADVVSVDRFGLNAEVTELTAYFKQYP